MDASQLPRALVGALLSIDSLITIQAPTEHIQDMVVLALALAKENVDLGLTLSESEQDRLQDEFILALSALTR